MKVFFGNSYWQKVTTMRLSIPLTIFCVCTFGMYDARAQEEPVEAAAEADAPQEEVIREVREPAPVIEPAAVEVDTRNLRTGEVKAADVKDFTASQRGGLEGSGKKAGASSPHETNTYERANRNAQDGRTGGGDEGLHGAAGEVNAQVLGKVGEGSKSPGSGPSRNPGGQADTGGRGSDGGGLDDGKGPASAETTLILNKVNVSGASKAPVDGRGQADGSAGGRGSDGGGLNDGNGPQNAETARVMNKVGGRQRAPITASNQADSGSGGRGNDGGALDKRLGNIAGGDALNKDRVNSGDHAKGWVDDFLNIGKKEPPAKPDKGGPPPGKPQLPPYDPKKGKGGAEAGAVGQVQTQSLAGAKPKQ